MVRSALGIRQPQHRAFARLKARHGAVEIGHTLGGAGVLVGGDALDIVADWDGRRTSQASAANVSRQIGGDAIQRIAAMGLVVVGGGGAQEAIKRFLQKVFSKLTVTGQAGEVCP